MDISIGDVISGIIIGSIATFFFIDFADREGGLFNDVGETFEVTSLASTSQFPTYVLQREGEIYYCAIRECRPIMSVDPETNESTPFFE